jgi:hypothetical protein
VARFRRIFIRAATFLSLSLCVATTVLWLRSHWVEDHCGYMRVDVVDGWVFEHRSGFFSADGRAAIGTGDLSMSRDAYMTHPLSPGRLCDVDRVGWDTGASSWVYAEFDDDFPLGFAAYPRGHGTAQMRGWFVSVPHGFLVLLLGLYPASRLPLGAAGGAVSVRRLLQAYAILIGVAAFLAFSGSDWPFMLWVAFAGLVAYVLFRTFPPTWRRPFAIGLCPTCGYDLRATPDRCPECGKIPSWRRRGRDDD